MKVISAYDTVGAVWGGGILAGPGVVRWLDPSKIRFSQRGVNGVDEIVESMKKNGWRGPPIDVVRMTDGGLTTVDNTRVLAASRANVQVKARVHAASDPLPADQIERFTTRNGTPGTWGEAVQLRIQKQGKAFREEYPSGSQITGSPE